MKTLKKVIAVITAAASATGIVSFDTNAADVPDIMDIPYYDILHIVDNYYNEDVEVLLQTITYADVDSDNENEIIAIYEAQESTFVQIALIFDGDSGSAPYIYYTEMGANIGPGGIHVMKDSNNGRTYVGCAYTGNHGAYIVEFYPNNENEIVSFEAEEWGDVSHYESLDAYLDDVSFLDRRYYLSGFTEGFEVPHDSMSEGDRLIADVGYTDIDSDGKKEICVVHYDYDSANDDARIYYIEAFDDANDTTPTIYDTLPDGSSAEDYYYCMHGSGDVNGDCNIGIDDASLVLSLYAAMAANLPLNISHSQLQAADFHYDSYIDIEDAQGILQHIAEVAAGLHDKVEAQSGDAYLAMVDNQWYVQYWGSANDLLTYEAGVVPITGNGNYTVSVNGASAGMLLDITGDANGEYTPTGCSFMAVIVKDGTTLYPNMAIEIKEIRVNGKKIPMTAKNYTSSDDGVEMRANIYNEWLKEAPEDAHDANGAVTDNSTYSAQIIDNNMITEWTSVEVDFTVTGIDG